MKTKQSKRNLVASLHCKYKYHIYQSISCQQQISWYGKKENCANKNDDIFKSKSHFDLSGVKNAQSISFLFLHGVNM